MTLPPPCPLLPAPSSVLSLSPSRPHFEIQDGSCNGLQHYAALGGDTLGAISVNLRPSDKPQDVYMSVADRVAALVEKGASSARLSRLAPVFQGVTAVVMVMPLNRCKRSNVPRPPLGPPDARQDHSQGRVSHETRATRFYRRALDL